MKNTIRLAGALAAASALAAGAQNAEAGCASPGNSHGAAAHMIPGFMLPGLKPKISAAPVSPGNPAKQIVGTWIVTYTAGGAPFGQAFIQWHDDGTEWENVNFPIEGGNICLGSWTAVDNRSVVRSHIGWMYTAGILSGYFTETEKDKLTGPNSYAGVNESTIYDLSGNVLATVPGTSSAVRFGP